MIKKPNCKFSIRDFFDACSISIADENSANAKSRHTFCAGNSLTFLFLKFTILNMFMIIKNCFQIIIFFFILTNNLYACFSFLPYAFNGKFAYLPKNMEICFNKNDGEIFLRQIWMEQEL